jgi:isoquinoline 1-oxidoreductase beta subunit
VTLTRREFLQRSAQAGAGLVIASWVPEWTHAADAPARGAALAPNAFVRIAPDESITVTVIRHEMGQGVRTLLPMMVAEELEADWRRIRVEQPVTGPAFKGVELHTSGSGSSRGTVMVMRRAGATAREMLVAAAAARWSVPATECQAKLGEVIHTPTGRKLSYGRLASEAARLPVPQDPKLKTPDQFTVLGKSRARVDGPDIVTGRARYGLDVKIPGMVYASIERAPVLGGRYLRHDDTAARALPGVIATVPVTQGIQHGVAVIATSTWAAQRARSVLKIEWERGPHASFDSDAFEAGLDEHLERAAFKVRHAGDAPAALAGAARRHRATYVFPFQAHAALETINCTADVRADRAEFWVPTQTQRRSMQAAVRVTGLAEETIRIHAVMMGGAFGRRLFADYVTEAAEISKAIGKPVQVSWTREDDTRHGYFQPCTAQRLEGGVDAAGRLVAFLHRSLASDLTIYDIHEGRGLYGAAPKPAKAPDAFETDQNPWGAYDNPYAIANLKVDAGDLPSPVPYGPWRAVMYPPTVWGRESFLDELAHLAGKDPLEFRLALLGGEPEKIGSYTIDRSRLARVHRLAAEKSGWGTPLTGGDGRRWGRGIAASVYHGGSYIAQVAEVSVAPDLSDLRVHRIVCAVDCGLVLHPEGLMGQAESGITWGLSYTLAGRLAFKDGRAVARGYADFPVMRMDRMPRTEVHVVPSQERSGGFGEHPVPMVAPAIGNAVFAATGVRVRTLPITPETLRAAAQTRG